MQENMHFIFLGGDSRQRYMATKLVNMKYHVTTYGLTLDVTDKLLQQASSLKSALMLGNIIICPVPLSLDGINIKSEQTLSDLTIHTLISNLNKNHIVYGGHLPSELKDACDKIQVPYYDLMQEESVSIKNAIATAEGTIAEAIIQSKNNIHGSSCLILGYGRCAKALADKLKGLNADVTICARSEEALAYADVYGYKTLPLSDLQYATIRYDFIFNSIPHPILDRTIIKKLDNKTIIIDIASNPGGTDFEACEEYGIKASLCLGLPGKYAPEASADILNNVILTQNIIKKEGIS